MNETSDHDLLIEAATKLERMHQDLAKIDGALQLKISVASFEQAKQAFYRAEALLEAKASLDFVQRLDKRVADLEKKWSGSAAACWSCRH